MLAVILKQTQDVRPPTMATTRTLAGGAIEVTIRGTPRPETRYAYAAVMNLHGGLRSLIRQSAESAAKDVLASHRAASWTWDDDDILRLRFTRGDPADVAKVVEAVLDRLESQYETLCERFDDPSFDEAVASVSQEPNGD